MCGIAGLLDVNHGGSAAALLGRVRAMTSAIAHRGPDGDGHWVEPEGGIALGHRRLAIIDLSAAGRQPMASADGRLVITYNGEIFNFLELRAELEGQGVRFKGHSDTEVIIEACALWGIGPTIRRLIGMFAIAIWETRTHRLHLVRDRLGIKPLYWGWQSGVLLFGSTPKALAADPAFERRIDRDALAASLHYNYIPAPRSAWLGVEKLRQGHHLTVHADGRVEQDCYWDLDGVAATGIANRLDEDDETVVERFHHLIADAVKRRMVADVPLGAFLSGGIDSSTVVALMQAQSAKRVKTFTIAWEDAQYSEAAEARAIAAHLGTDHHEIPVSPADALALIPQLAEWYDEPFADASMIPSVVVSAAARRHVTVALSGDGGDEVFAGYTRYQLGPRVDRAIGWVPRFARRGIGAVAGAVPPAAWDLAFTMVPADRRPRLAGDRLHKLARAIDYEDVDGFYGRLVSQWANPDQLMPGTAPPPPPGAGRAFRPFDFAERMQWLDQATYLPDDILAKVDRATMAVGLEGRVPLLDHRVVELAWRLPAAQRQRDGRGKWILRQILARHVPASLTERPKMGFAMPLDSWLRGPLADWAAELLRPEALERDGMFVAAPIVKLWNAHRRGRRNGQYALWSVLMIQAWRAQWA